jgi:hypothetical protein
MTINSNLNLTINLLKVGMSKVWSFPPDFTLVEGATAKELSKECHILPLYESGASNTSGCGRICVSLF